jgi:hypothetical protein
MSQRVDSSKIEGIVGVSRHPTDHYGRAVSAEQVFYILHSQRCVDELDDLRDCDYSRALDETVIDDRWVQDEPVVLAVEDWFLVPAEEETE